MLPLALLGAVGALVFVVFRLLSIGQRPRNYPPGPPTLPLIGNIHQVRSYPVHIGSECHTHSRQMPTRDAHLQFQKWAKEYGPIYSLILGTKTLVVLSSDQAVKDLLDKRSALYSHRQEMYIGQTLCSGGLRMLMMVGLHVEQLNVLVMLTQARDTPQSGEE